MAVTADDVAMAGFDISQCAPGDVTRFGLTAGVGLVAQVRLPAIAVRGVRPGPTAILVAGVHGDEFEGMAAVPELVARVDPLQSAGALLVLPICNPLAFDAQSRESPPAADGRNLAREFPGDPAGSPTQRLAAALFDLVSGLLGAEDLFVDLHSAGTRYRYLRLVGFRDIEGTARQASEETARHFGGGQLWRIPDGVGMFNAEIARRGVPTVAAEAPGQGECRPDDVEWYVTGLLNLLRFRGIVPGPAPARDDGPAGQPTEICAEVDGLFRTTIRTGDVVAAGAEVGRIHSPLGEPGAVVLAPHGGRVWALRSFGTVRAGDYLVWITQ